jgi:hypothetical protein
MQRNGIRMHPRGWSRSDRQRLPRRQRTQRSWRRRWRMRDDRKQGEGCHDRSRPRRKDVLMSQLLLILI